MVVIRCYQLLRWFGLTLLRPLNLKDRWSFNLGDDLEQWVMMRMFVYLDRLEKASGFKPVEVTAGPRPHAVLGCDHFTIAGPLKPGTVHGWCGCALVEIPVNST